MNKHKLKLRGILLSGSFLVGNLACLYAQTTPAAFQVKALSSSSVELKWVGVEDSFAIQRSSNGLTYEALVTLDKNTRCYKDSGLSASAPYLYKVCSIKNKLKSAYTSAFGVATKPLPPLTDITDDVSIKLSVLTENTKDVRENSSKLLDNDLNTKFLSYASTGWIQVEYPTGAILKQYMLTSANDAADRDPKEWKLEGSNDGTNWTILDTRKNQKFADRFTNLHFALENATSFTTYRLTIQKNNGNGSMLQLSEFKLFADCNITRNTKAPEAPTAFNFLSQRSVNNLEQIMPASHMIILNWADASTNEDGFVLERSTDQINWNWADTLDKNTTTYRSIELKPLTTYYYRLKSVNDFGSSSYVSTSATTITDVPPTTIVEDWDVHRATLTLKYYDDEVAVYYDADMDPTITWTKTAFNPIWKYLKTVYGNYSDPRLYIFFHAGKYSGGHPSTYARADHHYRNVLDCGTNEGTASAWQNNSGTNLGLPVHEISHIMEGSSLYVTGSPERGIWGDSKYAEIFIYDVYMHTNMAARAKMEYDELLKNNDSTTPTTGIYWFRDFYAPIYNQYGGNKVLGDFFKQMAKYIPQKNGVYTRDMNWGEFVHFYSIAAGTNLKSQAKKAFGWTDEWELQFVKAQADFPAQYADAPINIMEDGKSEVNYENTLDIYKSSHLFDQNLQTIYMALRTDNPTNPFKISVSGVLPTTLVDYSLTSSISTIQKFDPKEWNLYGTQNGVDWELIDSRKNEVFSARALTKTYKVSPLKPYYNYKLEITTLYDNTQTRLALSEIEFRGLQTNLEVVSLKPTSNKTAIDVYQLMYNLDVYPRNRVKIFSLDGRCVSDRTMTVEEWRAIQAGTVLPSGLYLFNLTTSPGEAGIGGKVLVK